MPPCRPQQGQEQHLPKQGGRGAAAAAAAAKNGTGRMLSKPHLGLWWRPTHRIDKNRFDVLVVRLSGATDSLRAPAGASALNRKKRP